MSRLLNGVLCFRGSAKIVRYNQLNLNVSEVFMGTFNCSSWASNQPSAGSESSSTEHRTENKALNNVDRDTRERERITQMRSRMRMLHGLDIENPTHDSTSSQYQNHSTDDSNENDSRTLSFTSEPSDVVSSNIVSADEEGLARTQSNFIQRLKEGSLPKKKMDRLIATPFGLVRVDSMNSLQSRPKISNKPAEMLGEIENVQKSGVKFGQSMPKHDQSELRHSHRELKVNESVQKHDRPELKHTELELRQGQSELKHRQSQVKRSQSEFRSHMSESHAELTTGQTRNKTAPISTRNKTASSPVFSPGNQVPSQHVKTPENPEPIGTNIFDQEYFDIRITDARTPDAQTETNAFQSENVFEEQYFGKSGTSPEETAQLPEEVFGSSVFSDIQNFSPDFTKPKHDRQAQSYKSNEPVNSDKNSQSVFDEQYFEQTGESVLSEKLETAKHSKVRPPKIRTAEVLSKLENPDQTEDTVFHEVVTKREIKQRSMPIANVENPTTAYDLAMKIRLEKKGKLATPSAAAGTHPRESKWSGQVDSKGFRILTEQVVDMQHLTENVVLNILRDSIIYEDDNIIAIDKPYGLPSHGGPGVHHSVGKFLGPLAAKVDKTGQLTSLHLVHRLDKETTGVMVLAKSQQTAEFLLALFKKRMVVKRYWTITKGIPNPTEGVIDIPMAEGSVENRYRMELRPIYRDEASFLSRATASLSGERREAVTNYKVLSSANGTALVECQPETGVKHQIRCHLAFGLNTPILGDHKYSHYSKMAPQRLYPEILQRLGIRQSKVRHLPMHLHAKALVLSEFKDGRNLFLSARLPKHFVQNMKWLKLETPQ